MTAPWGSKITIVIYAEGVQDSPRSIRAAEVAAEEAERAVRSYFAKPIDYVGAKVETVDEKPQDQDGR